MKNLAAACFIFVLTILVIFAAKASPHPLEKNKESRVLFMLFEGQNRKTVTEDATVNCKIKGPQRDWSCDHKTVKTVLMDALFVGVPREKFAKQTSMNCEQVNKEMREKILNRMGFEWGPNAFRREVAQALDGQWLCTFSANISPYNELLHAKEAEAKVPPVSEEANPGDTTLNKVKIPTGPVVPEVHTSAFGLTFLLNRDQSRIVSRNIVAWSNF